MPHAVDYGGTLRRRFREEGYLRGAKIGRELDAEGVDFIGVSSRV